MYLNPKPCANARFCYINLIYSFRAQSLSRLKNNGLKLVNTRGKVILDDGRKSGFLEECTKFTDKRDIDKDESHSKKARFGA